MPKRSVSSARAVRVAASARRAPRKIDFSDIPDSSPAQLKALRRVGRPPIGNEPRQLIAIRVDQHVLDQFRKEARRRVEETASLLRIDHLLDRSVSGLSGGDRQRVALGRAIVRQPKAFLMDEPLGALDSEFRHLMCGELRGLHDRMGATTIYVTHDQMEAMSMADKIMVMNHGVIEQLATPQEIYDRPASMYVADFIGSPSMGFLRFEGVVVSGKASVRIGGADIAVPRQYEGRAAGALALGIRPEHIRLRDDAALRGEVYGTEYLGTTQIVTLQTAHGRIKARLAATERVQVGETVGLDLVSERLVVFDGETGRALDSDLYRGVGHG